MAPFKVKVWGWAPVPFIFIQHWLYREDSNAQRRWLRRPLRFQNITTHKNCSLRVCTYDCMWLLAHVVMFMPQTLSYSCHLLCRKIILRLATRVRSTTRSHPTDLLCDDIYRHLQRDDVSLLNPAVDTILVDTAWANSLQFIVRECVIHCIARSAQFIARSKWVQCME